MSDLPDMEKASPGELQDWIKAAHNEVHRICEERWDGKHGWRTTIPADIHRDSDLIIGFGLSAGDEALKRLPAPLESLSDEAVLATAEEIMAWVEASGHKIGWGIANRIAQQFTRRAIAAHLPKEAP